MLSTWLFLNGYFIKSEYLSGHSEYVLNLDSIIFVRIGVLAIGLFSKKLKASKCDILQIVEYFFIDFVPLLSLKFNTSNYCDAILTTVLNFQLLIIFLIFTSIGGREVVEVKEFGVLDYVKCIAWCGDNICLGYATPKKEYVIISSTTGAMSQVFPSGKIPLAVSLDSGNLLLGKVCRHHFSFALFDVRI